MQAADLGGAGSGSTGLRVTGLGGDVLYRNALAGPEDVAGWVVEGPLDLGSHQGALELSGSLDDEEFGDHAH